MTAPLSAERLQRAYRQMKTIREFEERLHVEIATGEIPGFTHLYAGQEAVAVGVCEHARRRRLHREHPPRPRALHRQGLRRAGHDARDLRSLPTASAKARAARCTSPTSPRACSARTRSSAAARRSRWRGHRLPQSRQGQRVSVAFGGDGSCNQGTVFEAMNMAVVLKVPAIFVIEDNGYSEHTGKSTTRWARRTSPAAHARFGMPAETLRWRRFLRRVRSGGAALGARARAALARPRSKRRSRASTGTSKAIRSSIAPRTK